MEALKEKSLVHHGKGIRHARKLLRISTQKLADQLDVSEERLLEMEEEAKWTDENLQKAADAMDLEVGWFTHPHGWNEEDSPVTIINNENTYNDTFNDESGKYANNGGSEVNNGDVTHNYQTLDKVVDVFYKIINDHEETIQLLRKEIEELKKNK